MVLSGTEATTKVQARQQNVDVYAPNTQNKLLTIAYAERMELDRLATALSLSKVSGGVLLEKETTVGETPQKFKMTTPESSRIGTFKLNAGAGNSEILAYSASADEVKSAIQNLVGSDYNVEVTGEGSQGRPWLITLENDAADVTLTIAEDFMLDLGANFEEVDILDVGIILLNEKVSLKDFGGGKSTADTKLPTTEATFYANDGVKQTFLINPNNVPAGAHYTIHTDDKDIIDLKGYDASKVDFGSYVDGSQTLKLYASQTDRDSVDPSIEPLLTLTVTGYSHEIWEADLNFTREEPLLTSVIGAMAGLTTLTQSQLDASIRAAAEAIWLDLTDDDVAVQERFDEYSFIVVDLPDRELARASDKTIAFDLDAAGHGWFIDTTPDASTEFDASDNALADNSVGFWNQTHAYAESQNTDSIVATLAASDPDGIASYEFVYADASTNTVSEDTFYQIDAAGVITITAAGTAAAVNDFDAGNNSGDYRVRLTDTLSNTIDATVTLIVTDVDESLNFASQSHSYA